jgi:hypothetical protein
MLQIAWNIYLFSATDERIKRQKNNPTSLVVGDKLGEVGVPIRPTPGNTHKNNPEKAKIIIFLIHRARFCGLFCA